MPYVDNDKDIQPLKLPNENTLRYKTLIFIGDKADIIGPKGDIIDIIKVELSWEDKWDSSIMVEIIDNST